MKAPNLKALLLIVFSVTISGTGICQDMDSKNAVIKTLDAELKAWENKNYDEWSKHWVHSEYVNSTYSSSYYFYNVMGWDSMKTENQEYFTSDEPTMTVTKKGIEVFVDGNSAMAVQKGIFNEDRSMFPFEPMEIKRTVYLEKKDGVWKIKGEHMYDVSSYEQKDKNTEMHINVAGYYLLYSKKMDDAIKVFTLNTELFPDAFNTWDSLAEAYMMKGDKQKATKYYQKSLELNPKNNNAKEKLTELSAMK